MQACFGSELLIYQPIRCILRIINVKGVTIVQINTIKGLKISLFLLFGLAVAGCSQDAGEKEADITTTGENETFQEETVMHNAEVFFGKGAKGVGKAIEKIFSKYGEPNAYMTGSEAGAGLVIGVRYGDGDLFHKIEGTQPIHWTGPSIGLDIGADAAKVFTLVYNLYDTEEIFTRFAAVEGQFFIIGGAGVSVHKKKDIVIAQVRIGVGLRSQLSVGYLKFTKKRSMLPF